MDRDVKAHYRPHDPLPDGQAREFKPIGNLHDLQDILNSNTHISAILNHKRQVVLSNQHLFAASGLDDLDRVLGALPGDAMGCIHSTENNGCGNSDSCRYCGIVNTIRESQKFGKRVSNECRITIRIQGKLVFHDFRVVCAPLSFNGEPCTFMNLIDISHEKRNQMLENVFFHDIMNRLGGLHGIVQMIRSENKQPELEEYIDVLDIIGELVIEDIQTQRFLKAAENANLILNFREQSSYEIVESVRKQISFHPGLKNRQMVVCTDCADFTIKTDGALLKRILLNMAKNAMEASPDKGIVKISCGIKSNTASFAVNNAGTIEEEIKLQIFQRSFSTKGHGRGLGTYSMKLFGENYLKGKVFFRTNEKQGTTFSIELPLSQ